MRNYKSAGSACPEGERKTVYNARIKFIITYINNLSNILNIISRFGIGSYDDHRRSSILTAGRRPQGGGEEFAVARSSSGGHSAISK
jgi:hypothetical protein